MKGSTLEKDSPPSIGSGMRPIKARYQLWQIMLAIAALAGLFALLGVAFATAIVILVGALMLPIFLARPGRRPRAAAWTGALYPLLWLASLYATWFTAWLVLGHRPRSSLDDPKFISPLVEVPYIATFLCLVGSPYVLGLSFFLMLAHVGEGLCSETIPPPGRQRP